MIFYPYGPFHYSKQNNGLFNRDKNDWTSFWNDIDEGCPGLSNACGCYIFTLRGKPWYVGAAEKSVFKSECIQTHKIVHYDDAIQSTTGKPRFIFIAKLTKGDNFAKPSVNGHSDIRFLENMLIAWALWNNSKLRNIKSTKFLREITVPGFLNTPKGQGHLHAAQQLRQVLGLTT